MIDHHAALIYTMVLVSASDADMTDAELSTISETVRYLPVFRDFDTENLTRIAGDCTRLLGEADGLDTALEEIKEALPKKLRKRPTPSPATSRRPTATRPRRNCGCWSCYAKC